MNKEFYRGEIFYIRNESEYSGNIWLQIWIFVEERTRNMKMDKVAGSGNDEFYTPDYAVAPIMKYIPKGAKIWCPFDTEDSLFVKNFNRGGV